MFFEVLREFMTGFIKVEEALSFYCALVFFSISLILR